MAGQPNLTRLMLYDEDSDPDSKLKLDKGRSKYRRDDINKAFAVATLATSKQIKTNTVPVTPSSTTNSKFLKPVRLDYSNRKTATV